MWEGFLSMFVRSGSFSNIYLASDFLTEIKALINKHIAKNRNGYVWYIELGKDLTNCISRPDFLREMFSYLRVQETGVLYQIVIEFLENITEAQIKSLLESKDGVFLLGDIQVWFSADGIIFNSKAADRNKMRELFTKIERVRIPVIVKDPRPYIGEMVGADEDRGIEPTPGPNPRPSYAYRFGGNHDGEHWLTESANAQIKATAEIKGTVLTRYYQEAEGGGGQVANVLIHLDNTDIVMIIKDLVTLGPKTQAVRASTPDNRNTKIDESRFTDKNGNPISKIKLVAGDLIGTTMRWKDIGAAKYYPEYNREFGTFHFGFIYYKFVQEYRRLKGIGYRDGIATDVATDVSELTTIYDVITKKPKMTKLPMNWFIAPCSPESPVKCFK